MKTNRHRTVLGCEYAKFREAPAFTKGKRPRGAKRAGIGFEGKVQEGLRKIFGDGVLSNAWIHFTDLVYGERDCSPDVLVIDPVAGVVTIVECKLSHTGRAYEQLEGVYFPVVQALFPNYEVRGIEVCKHFVVGVDYPVKPNIVTSWGENFRGVGNVMVWNL